MNRNTIFIVVAALLIIVFIFCAVLLLLTLFLIPISVETTSISTQEVELIETEVLTDTNNSTKVLPALDKDNKSLNKRYNVSTSELSKAKAEKEFTLNKRYNITALGITPDDERSPVWSQDGKSVFYRKPDGKILYKVDVYSGSTTASPIMVYPSTPYGFFWSSNKDKIYYVNITNPSGNEDISVNDQEAAEQKEVWTACVMDIKTQEEETIAVFDVPMEAEEKCGEYIINPTVYGPISISPDRSKIVFMKWSKTDYAWVWVRKYYEKKWVKKKLSTALSMPDTIREEDDPAIPVCAEHEGTVWLWDLQTNEMRQLTSLGYCEGGSLIYDNIVWSPDGSTLAVMFINISDMIEGQAQEHIYLIDVESGLTEKVTSFPGVNGFPTWSPDSTKVIYYQSPSKYSWAAISTNTDIWVMNADGSNKKQLTDDPRHECEAVWSPDEKRIAYIISDKWSAPGPCEGNSEIWVMNVDGSSNELLISIPLDYCLITDIKWSPDASKIVFEVLCNAKVIDDVEYDIYLVDVPVI